MYRMKTRVLIFLFMLCCLSLDAQIRLEGYRQTDINPELLTGRWKAHWISMPGEPANVYGVYHMRKTFELDEVPSRFIVHVTADNRYKLYLIVELFVKRTFTIRFRYLPFCLTWTCTWGYL